MHRFPALGDAVAYACPADLRLRHLQQPRQIAVRETVLLGVFQHRLLRHAALQGQQCLLFFHQFLHLLYKVMFDLGQFKQLVHRGAFAQSLVHDKLPLAGGIYQHLEQLFPALFVKILGKAQAVASDLQAADGLLKSLLVGLADAHDLAHGPHLGAQLVLAVLEFFKGPPGKLDHHIVPAGHVLVQRAAHAAGDLVQSQPRRQHGGHQRDGESRGFAGQRRGAGGPGIDLDDHDTVADRIMGKLHIGAADDLHLIYDLICLLLQPLLQLLRDGQHGGGAERISGVYAQRVDILDKAHRNHIALGVPHHFQLQLFPAQNGLLHQHLAHQGCL